MYKIRNMRLKYLIRFCNLERTLKYPQRPHHMEQLRSPKHPYNKALFIIKRQISTKRELALRRCLRLSWIEMIVPSLLMPIWYKMHNFIKTRTRVWYLPIFRNIPTIMVRLSQMIKNFWKYIQSHKRERKRQQSITVSLDLVFPQILSIMILLCRGHSKVTRDPIIPTTKIKVSR